MFVSRTISCTFVSVVKTFRGPWGNVFRSASLIRYNKGLGVFTEAERLREPVPEPDEGRSSSELLNETRAVRLVRGLSQNFTIRKLHVMQIIGQASLFLIGGRGQTCFMTFFPPLLMLNKS